MIAKQMVNRGIGDSPGPRKKKERKGKGNEKETNDRLNSILFLFYFKEARTRCVAVTASVDSLPYT